jgi:plastocyanin
MPHIPRSRLAVSLVFLFVAACGGDNGADKAAPVALPGKVNDHGTRELEGETTLEFEADDFYFGPTYIKAAAGSTVTLEIHNEGDAAHTFTIDGAGIDQEIGPDATVSVPVTVSASTVAFYCRFHRDGGMQGAFFTG